MSEFQTVKRALGVWSRGLDDADEFISDTIERGGAGLQTNAQILNSLLAKAIIDRGDFLRSNPPNSDSGLRASPADISARLQNLESPELDNALKSLRETEKGLRNVVAMWANAAATQIWRQEKRAAVQHLTNAQAFLAAAGDASHQIREDVGGFFGGVKDVAEEAIKEGGKTARGLALPIAALGLGAVAIVIFFVLNK